MARKKPVTRTRQVKKTRRNSAGETEVYYDTESFTEYVTDTSSGYDSGSSSGSSDYGSSGGYSGE